MSFLNNTNLERSPGPITGNPLNGLCERVCIQVKKVFDACIKQITEQNLDLTIDTYTPANPAFPLTFISSRSISSQGIISNLTICPLEGSPNCARVRCDITTPVQIVYVDANGVEGVATSSVTFSQDVILSVPKPSIMPYSVEAVVSFVSPNGRFTTDSSVQVTACITLILKIVTEVELLIPSYGYCPIPPSQEYNQEMCAGFFELPLYPTSYSRQTR